MDPITAIGLASSILTFVDFATQIVIGTFEVYTSATGTTDENARIDTIISDLRDVTDDLDSSLVGNTKHEKALRRLASKCETLSDELLRILKDLAVAGGNSTWKSLKVIMKSMRKEKKVVKMEKQIGEYRSEILLRLTLMLNDQNSSIKAHLDRLENSGLKFSTESATQVFKLREDLRRVTSQLIQRNENLEQSTVATGELKDGMQEVRKALEALASKITTVPKENIILRKLYFNSMNLREESIAMAEEGTFEWIFEEKEEQSPLIENSKIIHSDKSSDKQDVSMEKQLPNAEVEDENDSLGSAEDNHNHPSNALILPSDSTKNVSSEHDLHEKNPEFQRKTKIEKEELEQKAKTRETFLNWLRVGNGVFHISGKAGSGKSTLMKFIGSHDRTQKELNIWADGKKLVFARFYFWKSNDNMQMSLAGLYRSILFETLRNCPELIPNVFPTQFRELETHSFYAEDASLSTYDIQKAFEILTSEGRFPDHRFCFLVDGLDEYNGDTVDHIRLARSLQHWTSGNDVKICASSRPYMEYLQTLSNSPERRIYLHELTKHDIYLFSKQMIEKELNSQRLKDIHLHLVERIVERSEGVFLWARLVVRSLLPGILRRDKMEALERKLDILPRDLNNLYDQLLDSLEPDDQERAVKMLILTMYNPSRYPLSSLVYAWIDNLNDPQFPPVDGHKPSSWPPVGDIVEEVQLQLTSLTKGLLQTVPLSKVLGWNDTDLERMPVVQFFHRTLRDFMLENAKLEGATARYSKLIERETYHRLWLAEMISTDTKYRLIQWNNSFLSSITDERVFPPLLHPRLVTGFSHILNQGPKIETEGLNDYSIFRGCTHYPGRWRWENRLSFVHLAAFSGQHEYVLQEILKDPELLNGNGKLHVLLSAAIGNRQGLVLNLLQNGSTPTDRVKCGESTVSACPIWMILMVYIVESYFGFQDPITLHETLELLLRHGEIEVDASKFILFLKELEDDARPTGYYITLQQFMEDIAVPNRDRLIALLNRHSNHSYINAASRFVSRFIPFSKDTGCATDKIDTEYTRLPAGYDKRLDLTSVIWGNLKIDRAGFRLY